MPMLSLTLTVLLFASGTTAAAEAADPGDGTDAAEAIAFPHGYPERKPATIAEACDILDAVLSAEDRDAFLDMTEDDLIGLHFGLGMWIRNNFGLWQGNEALMRELKGIEPDGASMTLIRAYWRRRIIRSREADQAAE